VVSEPALPAGGGQDIGPYYTFTIIRPRGASGKKEKRLRLKKQRGYFHARSGGCGVRLRDPAVPFLYSDGIMGMSLDWNGDTLTKEENAMTRADRRCESPRTLFSFCRRRRALLAAACLMLAALCAGCARDAGQTDAASATPVLAEKDGAVWLVRGDRATALGDLADFGPGQGAANALTMMDVSNGWVYYVTGYDADSATGDLMAVGPAADARPVLVAQGVCAVRGSKNGGVLFCKNIRDGAGELWLCAPGGQPEMVARSVVPDMFEFSPDGSRFCFVKREGGDCALYVRGGDGERMLGKARSGELHYFSAQFDSEGGLLFTLGGADEIRICTDADGQTQQSASGMPVGLFGAADDYLYMEWTPGLDSAQAAPLCYKAPGREAVRISEACAGVQFAGGFVRLETNDCPRAFLIAEPAGDIWLCTTDGGRTHIGQTALPSSMVLGGSLKTAAVIQDGSLKLFRAENGQWAEPKALGTCYDFDSDGRYLYWRDQDNALNRCDMDTGGTKKLLDNALAFTLAGGKVFACVDNASVCRLDAGGPVTLLDEGGDLLDAANGVYVSTYGGDIVYCPAEGQAAPALSGASLVTARSRLWYGAFTAEARAALQTLSADAQYYLDSTGMGMGGAAPETPHGTPEEDAALAMSLAPGTMPQDAWRAAGLYCGGFARLAAAGEDEAALADAQNMLGMAIELWDANSAGEE
jgi:hypothetical protein